MRRAGLILSISLFVAAAHAQDERDVCRDLLTLSPSGQSVLPAGAIHEMAKQFGRGSRAAALDFADNLRVVVDHLIEQKAITPQQAEHVFASRVLGGYAPIFLRFAIAELKARDFDDERVLDFVIHFENAFGAEEQIDFAVAVARRMLVTINDQASWSSAKGLDRYLEMIQAFGVSSETYANFLETWRYVRVAHPRTVVHFILANVRNAGDLVTAEANRQMTELRAQAEQVPVESSFWTSMFRPKPRASSREVDLREVTRRALDLTVPEFIQNVDGLIASDVPPESRLERFFGERSNENFAEFAERLELFAPSARNFLVENRIEDLDHGQLVELARSPIFPKLTPELQARVRAELKPFAAMTKLAQDIQRQLGQHSHQLSQRDRVRRAEVVEAILGSVQKKFDAQMADDDSDDAHRLSSVIMTAFTQAEKAHGYVTPREFVSAARRLITLVLQTEKGYLVLAVAETLANLSREHVMTTADVKDLINLLESKSVAEPGYDNQHCKLDEFDETPLALSARNWGAREDQMDEPLAENLPPALRDLMSEFRNLLPEEERHDLTDDELLENLKDLEPIKTTKTKRL